MLLNVRTLAISSRRMGGVQRTARTFDALQMVGQFEKQTRWPNSAGGTKMFAISRLRKPQRRHSGTAWFSENATR